MNTFKRNKHSSVYFLTSEFCLLMFTRSTHTNVPFITFGYASLDDDDDAVAMETAVCIALRRQRGRTEWTQMSHDLERQRVCTSEQSLGDAPRLCVCSRATRSDPVWSLHHVQKYKRDVSKTTQTCTWRDGDMKVCVCVCSVNKKYN